MSELSAFDKKANKMKTKLLSAILLLLAVTVKAQTPVFSWAKQISGEVFIGATTTDAAGNLYTTGTFVGTVDFDPGPGIDTVTEYGFGDMFITKMDSSGNLLWVKHIGGTSYDEGASIATDAAGNIYVAGFFSTDSVDFDPGPGVFMMSAGENSYVLKLDVNGDFVWAKQVTGIAENYAVSLTLDYQNNILVTGKFNGTADFDPNAGTNNMTSLSTDIYIWKLDNNGNFLWAKQIDALSGTQNYSIATDYTGNVFISGLLLGTTDFDPGTPVFNLTNSLITSAAFILKLNSSGDFAWAKKIENTDILLGNTSILADSAGNTYIGGSFSGTVDFDPNAGIQNLTAMAGNNCFLLKLDSNADFLWVKQLANVKGIAADNSGYVYTCGTSINKFSADGINQWMSGNSLSARISIDPWGDIYTSGTFTGIVDFDPGTGVYNLTDTATGTFVQKMKQQLESGINDLVANAGNFTIYPNPNTGAFYIESNTPGDFTLINDMGQIIQTISVKNNKQMLVTTEKLPNGLYLIFSNQTGKISPKIIVQQ